MRIVALLLLILTPWSVAAEPLRTDYLNSQLISQSTTAVPGGLLMLGLWLEHDAGWHTYWQNPGDSGLPTRMTVEIGGEEQQADFLWPLPERFPLDAQLVNFGYKGRVVLPLMVQLPSNLDGDSLSIRARASWLVCEEACIPGSG
ncbi:MAG: thiol:disulfide interchange protein, partial [Gammaproteobacteria bacterium HGW-Gammaproteobacteria-14]